MTKIETSNWSIQFQPREHSPSRMCQTYSFGQIGLDTCEDSPKTVVSDVSEIITGTVVSDQNMNGWIARIKDEFYSIADVESIYFAIEENNVDLWLIIPNRNFALLRRIVGREMVILENFADVEHTLFLFEFHVVYRCGADESQFLPKEAMSISRQ